MELVVWNLKGGQGKTVLSVSLAMLYDFYVVTNDVHSPIDDVLPEGKALRLNNTESLPKIPDSINLIYDFGGYPDSRVIDAAKQADYVVIPIIYESPLEMQVTINAIGEIEEYNNNIIIIANKCQKGDFARVHKVLKEFYDYPILEIKKSTAFAKAIEQKMSLQKIMESNKLLAYHYAKPLEQIKKIMEIIK